MSNDKFFSRAYVFPTIWATIVALIAFGGGLFWKSISGPDEVVVLKRENVKDTTVTVIQFKPDSAYFDKLAVMTSKSVKKQFTSDHSTQKKRAVDSLTLNIAKEYQLKFDSLRMLLEQKSTTVGTSSTNVVPTIGSSFTKPKRPKFIMPNVVGGYSEWRNLTSYATVSMDRSDFSNNEKGILTLNLLDNSTLSKITPVFIDIVKRVDNTHVNEMWSEQYELNGGHNSIPFPTNFPPGKYTVTVGFYFLNVLNTKFPPFNCKKYDITIK